MQITTQNIGDCPHCGDEIYIFRTSSRKRLAKCINEDCEDPITYPIPTKGKIEVTGILCTKFSLPVLAIVPNLRLKGGNYRAQTKKTYFWTKIPCFTCKVHKKCQELIDLQDEYD